MKTCRKGLHQYEPGPGRCPECMRERRRKHSRKWRAVHRDEHRAYAKAYYAAHRDQIIAQQRVRRRTQPGHETGRLRRYRARTRAHSYGCHHEPYDPRPLLEAQDWRCYYCGDPLVFTGWHLDHRVSLSRGGPDVLANVCWACPTCSLRKGSLNEDEFRALLVAGTCRNGHPHAYWEAGYCRECRRASNRRAGARNRLRALQRALDSLPLVLAPSVPSEGNVERP